MVLISQIHEKLTSRNPSPGQDRAKRHLVVSGLRQGRLTVTTGPPPTQVLTSERQNEVSSALLKQKTAFLSTS